MNSRLRTWWTRLPRKTRIQLIASVLMLFTGTEIFVLAPYVFEIAVMIDVFGAVLIYSALATYFQVWRGRFEWFFCVSIVRPLSSLQRQIALLDVAISRVPDGWFIRYFAVEAFIARSALCFCALLGFLIVVSKV